MFGAMKQHLRDQLHEIRQSGLAKSERVITTPQRARVRFHRAKTSLRTSLACSI